MANNVPTAAGHPDYTGLLIPFVWSSRILEKFYEYTVFSEIANTDYEGEIKSEGSKVTIRHRPSTKIRPYVKGQPLKTDVPDVTTSELVIDQARYWQFLVERVDEAQADIAYFEDWTTGAGEDLKVDTDRQVLQTIYADPVAANQGATAGKVSGNINLGVTGTPRALTSSNVIDWIVDAGVVLDEQSVPDADRWMVLPSKICGLIKRSDLKDASLTGDMESPLRNGRIGMIDRFTIYRSNQLYRNGAEHFPIFGHRSALTFAAQLLESDTIKAESTFGRLARGLFVYGYEVLKPDAMGAGCVTA